jgi:hypothetical protein
MSHLVIITADLHKIADLSINVKYRQPGNVVEYLPVEFEVFKDGNFYKAVPLPGVETRTLTNLLNEYVFQINNGKACNCKQGSEEIIDEIVRKMAQTNIVEVPQLLEESQNK